jgi:C-terminal processing protease CtpA/Prc
MCARRLPVSCPRLPTTNALVIDLRENGGGDSWTAALAASYLFDEKRVHLEDFVFRNGLTQQAWTTPRVAGKRFGGRKPVYILTSGRTFSGGEEFAYDLQALHRATVIGEKTGGGAHFSGIRALDDWFVIVVPCAHPINPVTRTDWEGVGVQPDIATSADGALAEALRRAAQDIGYTPAHNP